MKGGRVAPPPTKPPSTSPNPFLEEIDKLTPQELADYLYALAEEIIASPEEYKVKMGLEQLDIDDLDKIDLSTAAGRRKLAKILRLLAEQALRGKEAYLSSVVDKSKPGRGR
jgi:hypothetical protein